MSISSFQRCLRAFSLPRSLFWLRGNNIFQQHYMAKTHIKHWWFKWVKAEYKSYLLSYVAWCYSVHEWSRNTRFRLWTDISIWSELHALLSIGNEWLPVCRLSFVGDSEKQAWNAVETPVWWGSFSFFFFFCTSVNVVLHLRGLGCFYATASRVSHISECNRCKLVGVFDLTQLCTGLREL